MLLIFQMFALPTAAATMAWLTRWILLALQCSLTWASRCRRVGLIAIQAA